MALSMPTSSIAPAALMMALLSGAPAAAAPAATPKTKATGNDYVANRVPSLTPDRVVVYKKIGGRELELRVFLPEGWKASDRRACFHVIHGGGWTGMDPSRMYPFASDFAERHGMVGISVQYRLCQPGKTTVFECVKDARSSVRYVRSHAAELGIDPGRIVVGGGSAGGHLAAATALFDGVDEESDDRSVSCRPDALVLLFPVIDTSPAGYGNAKIGERWRELSPVHHVRAGLPPTILFHGTGDTVTPFAGAKAFHEAMLAAGNRCDLDMNEGGRHGYLMFEEALYGETLTKSSKFLASLGFVDPDKP
ncbi:MAG: alpha/beta hydrolase [Verrucomicrobia bacterium]|nr:alpha/beta hydrolase [Verrucomicrobiota bacterium]